jgi:hypothetical protein
MSPYGNTLGGVRCQNLMLGLSIHLTDGMYGRANRNLKPSLVTSPLRQIDQLLLFYEHASSYLHYPHCRLTRTRSTREETQVIQSFPFGGALGSVSRNQRTEESDRK